MTFFWGVFYQKYARGERCPAYTEGCFRLEDCSPCVKGTHCFKSHSWSSAKGLFIVRAVYNSLDPQLIRLCGATPPRLRQLLLCHSPSANLTPGRRARLPWFTKLSLRPSYLCGNERLAWNDGRSWCSNRNPESIQMDVSEPVESRWWVTFIRRAWLPSTWHHHKAIRLIGYCLLII